MHAIVTGSASSEVNSLASSLKRVTLIGFRVIFESKRKCPRWDSNPHFRLFESRLSNQLEYWGLRKGGYLLPCVVLPYRS